MLISFSEGVLCTLHMCLLYEYGFTSTCVIAIVTGDVESDGVYGYKGKLLSYICPWFVNKDMSGHAFGM